MLCDNHFDKNEFSKLSSLIIHKHEIALRKIIETRLNIISKYWQGFDVCDDLNNLLSATEKNEKIPTWIINDIAIDLRNNTPFGRNNRGQSKLDESPEKLHFPFWIEYLIISITIY